MYFIHFQAIFCYFLLLNLQEAIFHNIQLKLLHVSSRVFLFIYLGIDSWAPKTLQVRALITFLTRGLYSKTRPLDVDKVPVCVKYTSRHWPLICQYTNLWLDKPLTISQAACLYSTFGLR
jgi:hypothetical protein